MAVTVGPVIEKSKRIERLLKAKFGAVGNGMNELVNSIPGVLPTQVVSQIRWIATVRNGLVHEETFRFNGDEAAFWEACDSVIAALHSLSAPAKTPPPPSEETSHLYQPATARVSPYTSPQPQPASSPREERRSRRPLSTPGRAGRGLGLMLKSMVVVILIVLAIALIAQAAFLVPGLARAGATRVKPPLATALAGMGQAVEKRVEALDTPTPGSATGRSSLIVTANSLRVRSGPGTNFDVAGRVARGAALTPVGFSPDRSWIQVRLDPDTTGWVAANWVEWQGEAADLPVVKVTATAD